MESYGRASLQGTHLLSIVDINQAYPGAALAAGLHTTFEHRRPEPRHDHLHHHPYTWSKALTDNGSDRSNAPQNRRVHHSHLPGQPGRGRAGTEGLGSLGHPFDLHRRAQHRDHAQRGSGGVGYPRQQRGQLPRANQPAQYAGSAQSSAQGLTWVNPSGLASTIITSRCSARSARSAPRAVCSSR